ncbi:GNAT family N-acetyltransferase [Parvibaculum sedimenti]|uniref:GNAT family N-acetyltransferase n=1 Tax=Parvibaculum sedimenti TaxID=2608632 RepID=A0A6N6VME5_9HYPH|nr:GNAT family N-acetyltransferase [Parvibaculum sedimenti]KAB7742873.1 GNAT family N-acetyltransferase [Parvibaculum sedimenti]
MEKSPLTIRPLETRDRAAWDGLWAGYLAFYETALAPEVTGDTWARLLSGALIGLVAVDGEDRPLGFAHALLHAGTWSPKPLCYLEDLFVLPKARGQGAARALIEALAARGRKEGWLRLYWQTARDNATAQALYDKLATRTNWLRYDLDL